MRGPVMTLRILLVAVGAASYLGACRAGDFGDPLPLDQRVAALEKKVAALERKMGGFPELEQPTSKPIVSPFPATVVQNPPVNPDGTWAYPVTGVAYQTVGAGQTMTCVNGQCSIGSGFVQYQQPSRPGLFGRIFGR